MHSPSIRPSLSLDSKMQHTTPKCIKKQYAPRGVSATPYSIQKSLNVKSANNTYSLSVLSLGSARILL